MTTKINHIAIIMDGNRRWARARGLPSIEGYNHGAKRLFELCDAIIEENIPYATLYAWSTENWKRTKHEQNAVFTIISMALKKYQKYLLKRDIKLVHIGRSDRLPKKVLTRLQEVCKKTCNAKTLQVNMALDYGGRDEIVRAIKKIPKDTIDTLSEETFASYLDTANIPEVDIVIRTSEEYRISNFLLWQSAYAEFFFLDKHFPDLTKEDVHTIINEYYTRQRRTGI